MHNGSGDVSGGHRLPVLPLCPDQQLQLQGNERGLYLHPGPRGSHRPHVRLQRCARLQRHHQHSAHVLPPAGAAQSGPGHRLPARSLSDMEAQVPGVFRWATDGISCCPALAESLGFLWRSGSACAFREGNCLLPAVFASSGSFASCSLWSKQKNQMSLFVLLSYDILESFMQFFFQIWCIFSTRAV